MFTVRTMLALAVSSLAIAQTDVRPKDFTSASLYQRVKVHGKSLEGNLSKEPADRRAIRRGAIPKTRPAAFRSSICCTVTPTPILAGSGRNPAGPSSMETP